MMPFIAVSKRESVYGDEDTVHEINITIKSTEEYAAVLRNHQQEGGMDSNDRPLLDGRQS